MKRITLYSGSSGLNTVLDPQRLSSDPKAAELSQAVNVSIDDRGLVELRNGQVLLQAGSFHSLFCDGGDCFVVEERGSDAAIHRILSAAPLSTATVATGLTKGLRMAWGQIGGDTFYSNTVQKGYIRAGVRYDWPLQTYHGPDADMQFATAIPAVSHITFLPGGKILIAVGSAIFQNHAPYQYGLFHPARGNVATFDSDVTMLAGTTGGFYASDRGKTWFFRALEGWYFYKQEMVEDAPSMPGSLAHDRVNLTEISDQPGFARVWTTHDGVCMGTDNGTVINQTKQKVVYPTMYTAGACLIKGTTIIHTAS